MGYMLEKELLCDITFLVGAELDVVHAHKFMLSSRSPVFYRMFYGSLPEEGKIPLPDIEKETFTLLLRYIYTDNVELTPDNVIGLMFAAKKYCVDQLSRFCSDYLMQNVTPENACTILDASLCLSEDDVLEESLTEVKEEAKACLNSKGFLSLSRNGLKAIYELDDLAVEEEELFEHAIRWCEAECERQRIAATWENKRKVIGSAFYEIRFPLMDLHYFSTELGESPFMTSDEKVEIFLHHSLEKQIDDCVFKYKERKKVITKMDRFTIHTGGYILSGPADALSFKTSHSAVLHGVLVFGSNYMTCEYNVEVKLKDSEGEELTSLSTTLASNKSILMHEVYFEKAIKLQKETLYTVILRMVGESSKRGENGSKTINYKKGKTLTFVTSPLSQNGTDELRGQIPGLLLS